MFKKVKLVFLGLVVTVPIMLFAAPRLAIAPAYAETPQESACTGTGGTFTNGVCTNGTPGGINVQGALKSVVNTLIFVVGAISVIMIIIGGLRYTLSGGDSAGIKSAKDTILYAIVGIVVAVIAFAIVNFVISAFK